MIDLMERLLIDYEDRETIGEQTSRYRKERRAAAAEIARLRAELTEANALIGRLRDGLEPFAEFAETLNEWHTKSGFGEQKAFPQDRPVMFRTRPEGDDAVMKRELWPTHFRTAASLMAEIDAQNKTTPDAGSAEG